MVEGPKVIEIKGVKCVAYRVTNLECKSSGRVYYRKKTGDFLGAEGPVYVKTKNGKTLYA